MIFIKNTLAGESSNILVEATNADAYNNSPTNESAFRGYYAAINVGGGISECQFTTFGTGLNSYHSLKLTAGMRVRIVCTANGIFEVFAE